MEELYHNLKSRFNEGKIFLINSEIIEIKFSNSIETVIIKKGNKLNNYTISYPEFITLKKGNKTDRYSTMNNILFEGIIWILNQVKNNGKVLSEF